MLKPLHWMHRTLWLIGRPSSALALAAFVSSSFMIGHIGLPAATTIILLLLVALVYCRMLIGMNRDEARRLISAGLALA